MQVHLLDILDTAEIRGQREGSLTAVQISVALADELDYDARNFTLKNVGEGGAKERCQVK